MYQEDSSADFEGRTPQIRFNTDLWGCDAYGVEFGGCDDVLLGREAAAKADIFSLCVCWYLNCNRREAPYDLPAENKCIKQKLMQ